MARNTERKVNLDRDYNTSGRSWRQDYQEPKQTDKWVDDERWDQVANPQVSHAEHAFDPDFDIRGSSQARSRRESMINRQHREGQRMRNYSGFDSPWTPMYEDTFEEEVEKRQDTPEVRARRDHNLTHHAGEDTPYPGSSWSYAENEYFIKPSGERNFYGKGPKGWRRSDERIKDDVCEALYQSWEVDATHIDVSVNDGHVFLRGTVSSRPAKRRAEEAVEYVSGVDDVINELRIETSI